MWYRNPYLELAHQNYQLLLAPILSKSPSTQRLLIIPDGILSQIAFESLLYEEVDHLDANTPFLLKKYAISYLYSSSFLVLKNENKAVAACFGGFGIEYDEMTLKSIQDKGIVRSATINGMRSMGQLTYSDDEVSAIAKLLQGESWLNQSATKAAFLENAPRFRILHLAMHGALNEQQPLQSALIFTKTNDTTDYLLRAGELYNLRLHADMVVLSACNTGFGKIQKGEGVMSLSRAFAYAGCPSLVMSLWSVPDHSTSEIMTHFYQNLIVENTFKNSALRQAKLTYLDNTDALLAHPLFWAGFVPMGDMQPIELKKGLNWWIWGGISGVLLIAIIGFSFFRKNKVL